MALAISVSNVQRCTTSSALFWKGRGLWHSIKGPHLFKTCTFLPVKFLDLWSSDLGHFLILSDPSFPLCKVVGMMTPTLEAFLHGLLPSFCK